MLKDLLLCFTPLIQYHVESDCDYDMDNVQMQIYLSYVNSHPLLTELYQIQTYTVHQPKILLNK